MTKRTIAVLIIFISITVGIFLSKKFRTLPEEKSKVPETIEYSRIISLAPNITEILYALGIGKNIAGATRFCNYPPEARNIQRVGGFLDINYESIITLNPDLVILLPEHEKVQQNLRKLDLPFLIVENRSISKILNSISTIGKVCHAEQQATHLRSQIESRLKMIHEKTNSLARPSVLISVSHSMDTGTLKDLTIAGEKTFYNELITSAGGKNAYHGHTIAYPVLSAEGLILLNPSIIIDLIPNLHKENIKASTVLAQWQSISYIDAVKNNQVYIISEDYAVIPGPRFIRFVEELTRIIHPEIELEEF